MKLTWNDFNKYFGQNQQNTYKVLVISCYYIELLNLAVLIYTFFVVFWLTVLTWTWTL